MYWFQDPDQRAVKVPASWRVLYRSGDEWKPVEALGPYGVATDRYNQVSFKPVKATALRLELTLQPNYSAGIEEWRVH